MKNKKLEFLFLGLEVLFLILIVFFAVNFDNIFFTKNKVTSSSTDIDSINSSIINHEHIFLEEYKNDKTNHWHECSCGEKNNVEEHIFDEWNVVLNPTFDRDGLRERKCSICNYIEREYMPKEAHDHVLLNELFFDELYHWKQCSICNKKLEMKEHNYVDGICEICSCEDYFSKNFTFINKDTHSYEIVSYSGSGNKIYIPKEYNNRDVRLISSDTFTNNNDFLEVYYEGTIESWCNIKFSNEYSNPMFYAQHFYLRDNDNNWKEVTEIKIPNGITKIGYGFYGFNNVTKIIIPNTVMTIERTPFEEWHKLVEIYNLSSINITKGSTNNGYIGYYALDIYTSMNTPSKIHNVNDYLFYIDGDTRYLLGYVGEDTHLILPDSCDGKNYEIYNYAFFNYNNISSIVIPEGVKNIGYYAFQNCCNIENVYYKGTIESWCNISFSSSDSNPMAYAEHFYLKDSNNEWKELLELEIPNTITVIGNYQFYGFNNVRRVSPYARMN